jgi:hypothetical protein
MSAQAERDRLVTRARRGRATKVNERHPSQSRGLRTESAAALVLLLAAFLALALV